MLEDRAELWMLIERDRAPIVCEDSKEADAISAATGRKIVPLYAYPRDVMIKGLMEESQRLKAKASLVIKALENAADIFDAKSASLDGVLNTMRERRKYHDHIMRIMQAVQATPEGAALIEAALKTIGQEEDDKA